MLILLSVLIASALSIRVSNKHAAAIDEARLDAPAVRAELAELVNSDATSTWTASTEQNAFLATATLRQVRGLMGVKPRSKAAAKAAKKGMTPKRALTPAEIAALPTNFDSRSNWPNCWTITQIRDQSACGSCWAHAFAESASDRECTLGANKNVTLSVQQVNSCCDDCGDGCDGGQIDTPWQYWQDTGVVSANCEPYTLKSCDHHIPNSKNPCPMIEYTTPPCPTWGTCPTGNAWNLYFGQNPSYIDTGDVNSIKHEIVTNGPVQTAFSVYEDFTLYRSGVYKHKTGSFLGGHSVKIIGFGVENGVNYWLCANSWNTHWGDKGFFKIAQGDCGIDDEVTFGEPASMRKK